MIAAGASDYFSFGGILIFTVAVPCIGLIINVVSMQKRQGLNRKCAFSTLIFFIALLIEFVTWTISRNGSIPPKVEIGIMLGSAGIHALSAILAIMGLAEMRSRHKWSRGMKRGVWGFWLNILMLLVLAGWFYAHVNQRFHDGIFK
jgi:hypothetical protein